MPWIGSWRAALPKGTFSPPINHSGTLGKIGRDGAIGVERRPTTSNRTSALPANVRPFHTDLRTTHAQPVPTIGVASWARRAVASKAVRHADSTDLGDLEDLLSGLRAVDSLVERKSGIFYRHSRAFLHFHQDPNGLCADVRLDSDGDFIRMRVDTRTERALLLREVTRSVSSTSHRQRTE